MADGEKLRDALKGAGLDVLWRLADAADPAEILEESVTDLLFRAFDAGR